MSASEYWSRVEQYRDQQRAYEEESERQSQELSEFWDELDPAEKMAALKAIESRPRPRPPFRDHGEDDPTIR